MSYDDLSVTETDVMEHEKTTSKNVLGQVIKVEQEEGAYVEYEYDAIGNLVKTTPNGNEAMAVKMQYDILGNKIAMQDPDMGSWSYTYDALGQLKTQTDAKKQKTSIEYDKLGRKTKELTEDGVSSWHYDTAPNGLGKLAWESTDGITKTYSYTPYGKVKEVKTDIYNKSFTQSYTYNADGKVATTTQPNGFELINTYNAQGYLESIKSPAQQIKDFDFDHLDELVEKMMSSGLDYYKKALEQEDKAKELRAKADYYTKIAEKYAQYEKKYHDYAKRLRTYAKRYEYYGKKYASYSKSYRLAANYYYKKADRYSHSWWGRVRSAYYKRRADRYNYYAKKYAYWSKYYLNAAKRYNAYSDSYDRYSDSYERAKDYYLNKANELYEEADKLDKEAEESKRLAELNGGGADAEQISQAYQDIQKDSDYVYHYKVLEQSSLGKVTKYLSGNGLVTEDSYDKSGVMTDSKTGYTFDGGIRELHYEYYDNLSLRQREDKKLGITQNYGYDALDRIETVTFNGEHHSFSSHNYLYDVYGNMTTKDGNTLKYDNGNHQVSSLEDGKNFHYDANGNMDRNGNTKIEYNAQNKATRIITDKSSVSFYYDMNGNRFQKSQKFTDTYYIGKGYEYTKDGNGNINHKYLIYANGKVVTVHNEATQRDVNTGEAFTTHTTQYLHYDSLGSVDAITNQQGSVVERMAYKPFGEKLDLVKLQESITNRGYTGHEHIEDTPFIHMNARLYDPTIGRFLSADTIIQAPYDTQSYNRYSYVRNNPLKYTDPTGHSWLSKSWKKIKSHSRAIIGAVVGIAVAVYAPYLLATYGGVTFGTVAASGAVELTAVGAMSAGAIGGFVGGAITTGSLSGAIKGAVLGGLTAGFAYGIGNIGGYIGGNAGFATRVVLHGGLGSFMSKAQGGRWSSGFWSGAVGTSLAPLAETGDYYGNVASNAIIGGTVSSVTGGKFANGAVVGAFRYMFNDAMEHGKKVLDKLTFEDARERYMHGDGSSVNVKANSVDLSKVKVSDFKYIGQKKSVQLFIHGEAYTNMNDALVYGSITLVYAGGDQVGILPDTYDFEMHEWSSVGESFRNIATICARVVHHDFRSSFPSSHPFEITFYGSATIGGN